MKLHIKVLLILFVFFLSGGKVFVEESAAANNDITQNVQSAQSLSATPAPVEEIQASEDLILTSLDNHVHEHTADSHSSLMVEADTVSYLEENKYVEATGNVLVVYRSYIVTANQTELDLARDQLKIKHGFVMRRSEQYFTGKYLDYNLGKDEGVAHDVALDFGGAFVKGKKVEIKKDEIIVYNAVFTRCDLKVPCYRFEANMLTIYPAWNMMVAKDVVFYASKVPVMYVPTYIVEKNSNAYTNVVPRFGSNRTEGDYIKSQFAYYENEKLQGHWDIHYLEKLWYRVGVHNNYIWDDTSAGNVRLHYVGAKGFTGGFQHRMLLGTKPKDSEQRIEDFFLGVLPPSNAEFPEFIIDASSREIVGDQFVSYLPLLTFNTSHYEMPIKPWYWHLSLSAADILEEAARDEEEYNLTEGQRQRFARKRWALGISSTYDWMPLGMLSAGVSYDKSGYFLGAASTGYWYRFGSHLGVDRRIGFWDYDLGYSHIFDEGGFSPFVFDSFDLSTIDEWSIGTGIWFGDNHRLGYHVDYAVRENQLRNEDITLDVRLHHWQISLVFRTKLLQTYFSVTLL